MTRLIDRTGNVYDRLTVLEQAGRSSHGKVLWRCRCECGAEPIVIGEAMVFGYIRSCGCLKLDLLRERSTIHGMSSTTEFRIWAGFLNRCYNRRGQRYADYGGRGIVVCDRWRESFLAFYADMGPRPLGKSLDRIDNNGNYDPDNCRWATSSEQNANKRPYKTKGR